MKTQSKDHLESGKNERALLALDRLDADEMATIAQRRYAQGFPNPQHHGCPPQGEIAKSVSRSQAPDQSVLAHLFECSECFLEYRKALAHCQEEERGRNSWAPFLSLWRYSAALIAIALLFGAMWILRRSAPDKIDTQIARTTTTISQPEAKIDQGRAAQDQSTSTRSNEKSTAILTPRRVEGGRTRSISPPQSWTARIDLDNYRKLRDRDTRTGGKSDNRGVGEEIILVATSRSRLLLRLPETGVAGDYTISLVDAFDRVLVSRHAVSPDGVWLRVVFDLRRISPEKYRLCLSREGEAPAYYDVMIKKG
jgi:hypothetical protein